MELLHCSGTPSCCHCFGELSLLDALQQMLSTPQSSVIITFPGLARAGGHAQNCPTQDLLRTQCRHPLSFCLSSHSMNLTSFGACPTPSHMCVSSDTHMIKQWAKGTTHLVLLCLSLAAPFILHCVVFGVQSYWCCSRGEGKTDSCGYRAVATAALSAVSLPLSSCRS